MSQHRFCVPSRRLSGDLWPDTVDEAAPSVQLYSINSGYLMRLLDRVRLCNGTEVQYLHVIGCTVYTISVFKTCFCVTE